jgi:hypothetical protein
MGTNIKDAVTALLARDEPPELDGMPRGLEENGALRKAIEASIKYWNAWRDCQLQLIEIEDAQSILQAGGRARRRYVFVCAYAAGLTLVSVVRWCGLL